MRLPFGINITRTRIKEKTGHELSDEDREIGLMIRQQNAARRRLQSQIEIARLDKELAEARAELAAVREESGDDGIDGLFSEFLGRILGGGNSVNPPPRSDDQAEPLVTLTDAAIEDKIRSLPPTAIAVGKQLSDEKLREYLTNSTDYDDDTVERAIRIFRTKNF